MIGQVLSKAYEACKTSIASATTAGTMYLVNSIPMLALNDALANADNVFVHDAAKVEYTKETGQAWTPGDKVYWDDTNKRLTKTATANTLCGYAAEEAASADTTGKFKLAQYLTP